MNSLCASGHKLSQPAAKGGLLFAQRGRSSSSYPGGRVFFVHAGAHWLGTVGGRAFSVHTGRNAHWLGARRTLCFCLHTKAHANCLFRKLGHFVHAVVSLEKLFGGGRPPGHCIPHSHWFTHTLGICKRKSRQYWTFQYQYNPNPQPTSCRCWYATPCCTQTTIAHLAELDCLDLSLLLLQFTFFKDQSEIDIYKIDQ